MNSSFFKKILLLAGLFLSFSCFSQNNQIDSLLNLLPNTTDTIRFDVLSKLFWSTFNTDPHLAKTYIDEERELAKDLENELYLGRSFNDLGVYYWTQSQLDSSIWSFKQALKVFQKIEIKDRENATLNNLGNLYADKGDYDEAVNYYLQSIKIKEELGVRRDLATSYNNIGNIYVESNDLEKGKQYYDKSLELALEFNDTATLTVCYSGIAMIHQNQKEFRKAINYSARALSLSRKSNNQYAVALNLGNMGQNYYRISNFDSSLYYLEQASMINSEIGNQHALAINYREMARVLIDKNMFNQALNQLQNSLNIASEIEAMREVMHGYEVYSYLYEKKRDYLQSLEYYKKFKTVQDSILNEETKLKMNELELSYETEKKEKEIAEQNLEIETLKKAALIEGFRRKWLIGGLVVAVMLGGLTYYSQRQRLKRQKLESEKKRLEVENELTIKKKELTTHTLHLVQKNDLLDDLSVKLRELKKSPQVNKTEINHLIQKIKSDKVADKDWDNFKLYFDQVHEDFDNKLRQYFNDLTSNEIRLAALMKMKLSTKEIASILNISPDSVNKARYRLRKKLNMDSEDRLEDFILAL